MSRETIEIKPTIRFKEFFKIDELLKKNIELAITEVWKEYVGHPITFEVVIASYLTKDGKKIDTSAAYYVDTHSFQFAIETIDRVFNTGLALRDNLLLVAAHEAYHAVQFETGDPPPFRDENDHYDDDRHEEEAWIAAAKFFKKVYPNASGTLAFGKRKITI